MFKLNKILLLVIILLVVVVAFGTYKYYQLSSHSAQFRSSCISITPPKGVAEDWTWKVRYPTPIPVLNPLPLAIDRRTLGMIAQWHKVPEREIYLTTDTKAKIDKINSTGMNQYGFYFPLALHFAGYQSWNWYKFLDYEVKQMKVFIINNGNKIPAQFADIKIGDTVLIHDVLNPFYYINDSRIKVETEINIYR